MCEKCIERDKKLTECSQRRFYCEFYICSEQPKKRKQLNEVSDERICEEVDRMIEKGNNRNTSIIMVASRFELGMPVIRSRYLRHKSENEQASATRLHSKSKKKPKRVYA
jgi:hypothetical protein